MRWPAVGGRPDPTDAEPAEGRGPVAGPERSARPRQGCAVHPVIELRNVVKTYQMGSVEVHALRGVSLTVERGDFVAIMGASGSGKSTMMNIIGCLDVPTRGRYRLDGVDVRRLDERSLARIRNHKIGFVFQSFNLIPRTSALANVELPLAYAGIPPRERRLIAIAALERVGLGERADHMPNEMSGGQQQRCAVARALATNPALILADEPTGNLDTASSAEVLQVFSNLNAEGRTVVLITHEDEIAAYTKRLVHLRDGHVVADDRRHAINAPPPRPRRPAEAAS
jgi:putative ABC transport system ATP-binding protein